MGASEKEKRWWWYAMVQWPDWGVPSARIGFVYIREPESMDDSNFRHRWWVSRLLNCQMCGVRSGWKYGENSPKSHKRQDWAETHFFKGILCKHVTWRLLKPWCNTKHENVQIGKNSIFPWFWPFSVRYSVSTWATVQGSLGVPLHDMWLQVVNEDFHEKLIPLKPSAGYCDAN
jgi:hypothetical protein